MYFIESSYIYILEEGIYHIIRLIFLSDELNCFRAYFQNLYPIFFFNAFAVTVVVYPERFLVFVLFVQSCQF